jgi:tRNA pseudouridine32 synthase/23S rRNA pseudouridine746 synthase
MTSAVHKASLPMKDGVSPSCVALPKGPWLTVLDFLAERIPAVSRDEWAQRLRDGLVVNEQGQPVPLDAPYKAPAKLYYWRSLPFEHHVPFEETVVFQDEYLVVADKPPFLPVTPKGRYLQETLLVRLKRKLGIATLVPMHRIDRETSGLVAFTIQPHTRDAYQSLFRDKVVSKTYEAIAPLNATLQLPMLYRSRLEESAHFMAMHEVDGPVNAETHIDLIEARGPWGRYRLQPVTGQKHQLRAHLCALSIPIRHDQIYPELKPSLPPDVAPDFSQPLQLLAQSLSFTDPITGQLRAFHCGRSLSLDQINAAPPSPRPGEQVWQAPTQG